MTLRKIFVIPLLFLATCDVEKPVAVVNAPRADVIQTEPMPEKWASGYYTGWMRNICTPAEVDYSALTHVMHFSVGPNSNGTLDLMVNGIWGTAEYNAVTTDLISRTHLYGRKILISIGGWNTESAWVGATSPANRTAFIERIISFVQERGYDGVDVDWEPLTDAAAYDSFIREFHVALKAANQGYLLTAACVGEPVFAGLSNLFDQINLMTYDMSGAWPDWVVWHNSALHNGGQTFPKVEGKEVPCVENWVLDALQNGIPAEKLGVGTAFQGFIWQRKWEPMQDATGSRVEGNVPYYELMESYGLSHKIFDETARVPYLSYPDKPGRFVSYEDAQSITEKIAYLKSVGLGGLIIWDIAGGYQRGQSPPDELLQAVRMGIFGSPSPEPPPPPAPPCVMIGNDAHDSSLDQQNDMMYGFQYMATESGTLDRLEIYITEPAQGTISMALYADRGNKPGNLLSAANDITAIALGWNSTNLQKKVQMDTFGKYWICMKTNSASVKFGVNASGGKTVRKEEPYMPDWPSSFGTVSYRSPEAWTVMAKGGSCQ